MRPRLIAALALAVGLAVAAPASAHVTVLPSQLVVNEGQEVTVRVPTERDIPTIAVEVDAPPGVTVFAAQPAPGWRQTTLLTPDGRTRGVRWSGGRIGVGQFMDFHLLATPTKTGQVVWRSRQTYADGKVKPWTGAPEAPGQASTENGPTAPGPASAMQIVTASQAAAGQASTSGGGSSSSGAGIWLGIIAIAIAATAAVGVGLLWSSRPATLPPDEDEAPAPARAPRPSRPQREEVAEAAPEPAEEPAQAAAQPASGQQRSGRRRRR